MQELLEFVQKTAIHQTTHLECQNYFIRYWILNELELEDDIIFIFFTSGLSSSAPVMSRRCKFDSISCSVDWKRTVLFNTLFCLKYELFTYKCSKQNDCFVINEENGISSSDNLLVTSYRMVENKGFTNGYPRVSFYNTSLNDTCQICYKSSDRENSDEMEYVGIELFAFVSESRKKLIFEGAISLQLMLRTCKKDSGIINFNGPNQSGSGELAVKKNDKELTCQVKYIEIEWMDLIHKLFR